MKIYTKTGDSGETGLYGNVRVPKDHARIGVYGTLDETNAQLGMALSDPQIAAEMRDWLVRVQGELFVLGAELATPKGRKPKGRVLVESDIERLEREIDALEATLPPLKNFILPGGARAACALHLARAVLRRAERELVCLHRHEPQRAEALRYVNRLSDYLFVCARAANQAAGIAEVAWVSG